MVKVVFGLTSCLQAYRLPVCPHCCQRDLFKIENVVMSLLSIKSFTGPLMTSRVSQIPWSPGTSSPWTRLCSHTSSVLVIGCYLQALRGHLHTLNFHRLATHPCHSQIPCSSRFSSSTTFFSTASPMPRSGCNVSPVLQQILLFMSGSGYHFFIPQAFLSTCYLPGGVLVCWLGIGSI